MVYQDEVEFSTGTGMQRLIVCGGVDGLGKVPLVSVQSVTVAGKVRLGWFDTTNIQLDGNEVVATLVFTGLASVFTSLCTARVDGQLNLLAAEPFSVALRFR